MAKASLQTGLISAGFAIAVSSQILNPILSLYLHLHLGASLTQTGQAFAFFWLSAVLLRIPLTAFGRAGGVNNLLMLGIIVNTLVSFAYVLAPDMNSILVIRLIHGATMAFDMTTLLTLVGLLVPDRESLSRSVERFTSALAIGSVLGPVISTAVFTLLGFEFTILTSALFSTMAVAAIYPLWRSGKGSFMLEEIKVPSWREASFLLHTSGLRLSSVMILCQSFTYGMLVAYAPLVATTNLGLSVEAVTLLFFVYFGIMVTCRVLLGRLLRRLGMRALLYAGFVSAAVGMLFLGLGSNLIVFSLGFEAIGVSHGFTFPLTATLCARAVPPRSRTLGNAIYLSAADVGALAGPLWGSLWVSFFSLQTAFMFSVVAPLVGFILATRTAKAGVE